MQTTTRKPLTLADRLTAARERDARNAAIGREACSKLRSYLATGIKGFKAQADDRCRALGIVPCEDAQHLLNHLKMFGW